MTPKQFKKYDQITIATLKTYQELKGSTTKRFFPTIVDAHSIKSNKSLPSHLSQILTGNSLLNYHQYRLKFVTSPECACGCNI